MRLLFDGYNAYATDDGYLFAAPPSSALYVPVMTGSYAPPAPPAHTGSAADYIAARIAESERRIAEIEREKYPLYRAERENDENIKALRRMRIKKRLLERRENFERRVKELREKRRNCAVSTAIRRGSCRSASTKSPPVRRPNGKNKKNCAKATKIS